MSDTRGRRHYKGLSTVTPMMQQDTPCCRVIWAGRGMATTMAIYHER
jgi:hypothetical protein